MKLFTAALPITRRLASSSTEGKEEITSKLSRHLFGDISLYLAGVGGAFIMVSFVRHGGHTGGNYWSFINNFSGKKH
jgi:hypothetical protein